MCRKIHERARRRARLRRAAILLSLLTLNALPRVSTMARAVGADLVLNEVFYDATGADEGREFIELWNPDSVAHSLDGITIEAGDGARPGSWVAVFEGAPGATVAPGTPYLIDASGLRAALENGPDALRLRRGAALLDLLGYGELDDASLFEGAPAVDVPSGQSLARIEDGLDRDRNDADWAPDPHPTPGRPNRPARAVGLSLADVSPEVAWPAEPVRIRARIRNRGKEALASHEWGIRVERFAAPGESLPAWPLLDGLDMPGVAVDVGESTTVEVTIPAPPRGPYVLRLRSFDRALSGAFDPDTAEVRLRSGAGPAVINEIAFRDRGAGEWIELYVLEAIASLGAFSVRDRDGRPAAIDDGGTTRAVSPGTYIVVASDPARVVGAFALPESIALGVRGAWPTLNDLDRSDGYADVTRLIGPDGVPCDAVPYRGSASARGGSLERLSPDLPSGAAGSWFESAAPERATPGRPNSLTAPSGPPPGRKALLVASGIALRRAADGSLAPVVLRLTAEAQGLALHVRVHDLLGRTVRRLLDGQRVFGEAALPWDGRDDEGRSVPAGLYVVAAEGRSAPEEPARRSSLLVAVPAEVGP